MDHIHLWQHLSLEWQKLLRSEQATWRMPAIPLVLWVRCIDDQAVPHTLLTNVEALAASIDAQLRLGPAGPLHSLQVDIEQADLLMLLALENPPQVTSDSDQPSRRIWSQRRLQQRPHQCTTVLHLCQDTGRLTWDRYPIQADGQPTSRSRSQLLVERQRHLGYWLSLWYQVDEASLADPMPSLSEQGWQAESFVCRAQALSRSQSAHSCRRLLRISLPLVAAVWILPALWGRVGLAISLLLLLVGGSLSWRQVRHLHEWARQWWCLGHGLWVQHTWHRFGLDPLASERLGHDRPLAIINQRNGPLAPLLHAHQMALLWAPEPAAWTETDLNDVVLMLDRQLEQLQDRLDRSIRFRGIQCLALLLSVGMILMLVFHPGAVGPLWMKQAFLSSAFLVWLLWMLRPVDALSPQRLRRHAAQLGHELRQLRDWQHRDDLRLPPLRAVVQASVLRIGQEELDLARDGLEAQPWS